MGNILWGAIPANTTQGAGTVMTDVAGTWTAKPLIYKHISFSVPSPVASRGAWIFQTPQSLTIKSISACVKSATSVTFNIEIHSDPLSAGTNAMTSDLVATTSGAVDTSVANPTVAANDWFFIDISATSGSPAILTVTIACQIT